jgi:hypothetical protein
MRLKLHTRVGLELDIYNPILGTYRPILRLSDYFPAEAHRLDPICD